MLKILLITILAFSSVYANKAIIEDIQVVKEQNIYRFSVRIFHQDSGWEHYVNRYEVMNRKGHLLATRILVHPHVDEQPFTRSIKVKIEGLKKVYIRAHDSVDGYTELYEVTLP